MKKLILALSLTVLAACSQQKAVSTFESQSNDLLYSNRGVEKEVSFDAVYRTTYTDLEQFKNEGAGYVQYDLPRVVDYIFGPLVTAQKGSPHRNNDLQIKNEQARLESGFVVVPYRYVGQWILSNDLRDATTMDLPLPYDTTSLNTPNWKQCGDSAPDHQTWGFIWYFWDPTRYGCDHKEGVQYQVVHVQIGNETRQTTLSYPEYARMIRSEGSKKTLKMTFGFGYVEDRPNPNPFRDYDDGARQFQAFYRQVDSILSPLHFKKYSIKQSDYGMGGSTVIGTRFVGRKDGVEVQVSVVANAGVDQMNLFAKSYAEDHEAFFGWFGHSRVGSGFDAENFKNMVEIQPQKYSITSDYQIIYWAGCNSYSYYTTPFFQMKADLDPEHDPRGTKNLDIVSNGLPSFFTLNSINAEIFFRALLNWQNPTSYQSLVTDAENRAAGMGSVVLVNVLGDEDNQ